MKVHLLGTGAADGWPNPFCTCLSCATQRTAGIARLNSSALIDGVILIDPGPQVPAACALQGVNLSQVTDILVTHGHPDHCAPSLMLFHQWVASAEPLRVWGPAEALAQFRPWLAPDQRVTLHPIIAGDDVTLPAHTVRAYAAAHAHGDGDIMAREALVYRVHDHSASILYATDTGPLSDVTLSNLGGYPLDVVVVDATFGTKSDHGTGHHDFDSLAHELGRLRHLGALTETTRVIATHLSHHNPPEPLLRERLGEMGAYPGRDGDVIDTDHKKGRVTFVTGGARSGKSRFAEDAAARHGGPVTYIATAPTYPDDAEWAERLDLHRSRRPAEWTCVETADPVSAIVGLDRTSVVLIDCLGMWLTRILDDHQAWDLKPTHARDVVEAAVERLEAGLHACSADMILVSNEVGMGIVPDTASGRLFRDLLGLANTRVAAVADTVVFMVAGRAVITESS